MRLFDVNVLVQGFRADVPDLWFAALAIESGCTWVSGDRDYRLVPGLDWEFVHR